MSDRESLLRLLHPEAETLEDCERLERAKVASVIRDCMLNLKRPEDLTADERVRLAEAREKARRQKKGDPADRRRLWGECPTCKRRFRRKRKL